jgi:exopolysaccharide biosynthesis polyprenyl glycosylphosphotransferase
MFADIAGLMAVTIGAMWVFHRWTWPTYSFTAYLSSFTVITALFVASLYFGGLYESEPRLGAPAFLPRAGRQTLAAGGIVAILNLGATGLAQRYGFATDRALPMPTTVLVVLIVAGAVIVAFNRRMAMAVRVRREGLPRVFLVGLPEDLGLAREHLDDDAGKAEVVGQSSDVDTLVDQAIAATATDVLIASPQMLDELYPEAIMDLESASLAVLYRVSARETLFGLQRVRQVGGLPFLLLREHTVPRSRVRSKRVFDLTLTIVLLPILLPLLAVVTMWQLAVAGRPLLLRQQRVGRDGKTFELVKFRTMIVDAERTTGPVLADREDPRVIRKSIWLRRSRLDELPQLWNILKGEMSLVGPRPERPELAAVHAQQIPGYERRHEFPPGITGLAQVQGRYHTDAEYKLGYDIQYLVNWSPVLDAEILVKTILVVLTGRQ